MAFPIVIKGKYAARCSTCRKSLKPGEGFAVKVSDAARWQPYCKSDQCLPPEAVKRVSGAASSQDEQSSRREITATGAIYMPYDKDAIPLLRSFPGARWNAESKNWSVSLAVKDRARVLELAAKLQLKIAPELREYDIGEGCRIARERASGLQLRPYQVTGAEFLCLHDRALLGDDMGLGKTVQVLSAIPKDGRTIVICPTTLKYNWQNETRRWRPDLKTTILSGRNSFRWPEASEIVIINYDILPAWLIDRDESEDEQGSHDPFSHIDPTERNAAKGVTVVIDEAQKTKNHKAARSKKVKVLCGIATRSWLLTGTPLMNKPPDLWGVLSTGYMQRDVFGSWKKFVALFNGFKGSYGYEWGQPDGPEVAERLRRVMLRRTKPEVLPELPSKQRSAVLVDPNSGLRKQLDEAWLRLEPEIGEGELPGIESMSHLRASLATAKIDQLLELVESYEEQETPLLVFSAHREPIDILGQREGWAKIEGGMSPKDRADNVAAFQAGKLKGLALTIGAGGEGITLTRASNIIFVDLDWTPAMNLQSEDRVVRIGQTASSVNIITLVIDHPLDRHVNALLVRKMALIEASIEGVADTVQLQESALKNALPDLIHEDPIEWRKRLDAAQRKRSKGDRTSNEIREHLEASGALEKAIARVAPGHRSGLDAPLTPELRAEIEGALSSMLEATDPTWPKDGAGFNRPDAARAILLLSTWDLQAESMYRLAHAMLAKYYRQLHDRFPLLFER